MVLKQLDNAINSRQMHLPRRTASPGLSTQQESSQSHGNQKLQEIMRSVTRTEHIEGEGIMKK